MQPAGPAGETFSARVVLGSPNLELVNSTTDRGLFNVSKNLDSNAMLNVDSHKPIMPLAMSSKIYLCNDPTIDVYVAQISGGLF